MPFEMIQIKQNAPCRPEIFEPKKKVTENILKIMPEGLSLEGKKIGIAVGSRGIDKLPDLVLPIVEYIKSIHGVPIIFGAMGSHGGGTAAGQTEVLESLGITEKSMGCSISCCDENVYLGNTPSGYPVYYNKVIDSFDHVVLINRIKPHTDFTYETESGLLKMFAIGFGNPKGAFTVHGLALSEGYGKAITETAFLMIEKLPILFGVAVCENWKSKLCHVEAILPQNFYEREKSLLAEVKNDLVKLPSKAFDLLIVGEIGKNISGCGMDTKTIGRIMIKGQKEPDYPVIGRIVVLGLTPESHGNATGIGLSDITTKKVFAKIDVEATALNSLTSMSPEQGRLPCIVENDCEAIKWGIQSLGNIPFEKAKVIYIKNTSSLETIAVSKPLYEELAKTGGITALSEFEELSFDPEGNLLNFRNL